MLKRFSCGLLCLLVLAVHAAEQRPTVVATVDNGAEGALEPNENANASCPFCTNGELDALKIQRADALATQLLQLHEKLELLVPHSASIQTLSSLENDASAADITSLLSTMAEAKRATQARSRPKPPPPKRGPMGLQGLLPAYAETGRPGETPQAAVVSHGVPIPLASPGASFLHNGERYSFEGVRQLNGNGNGEKRLVIRLKTADKIVELPWSR